MHCGMHLVKFYRYLIGRESATGLSQLLMTETVGRIQGSAGRQKETQAKIETGKKTKGETPDCAIKDDDAVMDGILVCGESHGHAGVHVGA